MVLRSVSAGLELANRLSRSFTSGISLYLHIPTLFSTLLETGGPVFIYIPIANKEALVKGSFCKRSSRLMQLKYPRIHHHTRVCYITVGRNYVL